MIKEEHAAGKLNQKKINQILLVMKDSQSGFKIYLKVYKKI
jgi:hypothetical protein